MRCGTSRAFSPTVTTATVSVILDHVAHALEGLMRRYQALAQECRDVDSGRAELAAFLGAREQETVEALERYRSDAHSIALDTHVRFGSGFPYSSDDLQLPGHATIDELIDLARRTDTLVEQLSERIQVY